ncbi:MAG: sigma-70 family RNA polymerase sigma factor [Chloroflexaceae bacterium]|nr:sigma-70 family RNA polymerase sigma factor [Chloroflexaceae bacterium]
MAEPSIDVIRQAQQGDPQAQTQLVLEQQQYVYSIAMSVLKNPDDAADLTQEAFIRLFRALPQYSGESRFTTWLYRLVVNLGRDELRRRGRRLPVITPESEDEQDPINTVADQDRWNDPVQALDSRELRDQVRRALNQLDEHYRLVLTLYYFEDLKYNDIAQILDMPLNTVKSHIRRGKERLAALIEAQEQPPSAYRTSITSPLPPVSRSTTQPKPSAGLSRLHLMPQGG